MSESRELVLNPTFEPIFYDDLEDKRYYQLYGGRGSGKSFVASIASVEKACSRKWRHKILYLRQTMTSLEDSSISDVRTAIAVLGKEKEFVEKKGTITNRITGNTITFKGIRSSGSQTAKLKSLSGVTTLIIEEAEEVESFEEFSKVDESIRLKGVPLKIMLVYNPTSSVASWIHKEWFVDGQPNRKRYVDTVFMHSTYLDNIENLNESVVKRYEMLRTTDPTYYRNTILAEWTLEVANRIYGGWQEYDYFKQEGDTWYGLDFGYGGKDKTALIKVTWFEDVYYVEELFSIAKLRMNECIKLMKDKDIPYSAKIYADSAVPELREQIRDAGWKTCRKAFKGNVEAGIKRVQDKAITIVGESPNLYESYMTFRREPSGKLPHEPDELAALRYAINSKKPIKKKAPEPGSWERIRRRQRRAKGFI